VGLDWGVAEVEEAGEVGVGVDVEKEPAEPEFSLTGLDTMLHKLQNACSVIVNWEYAYWLLMSRWSVRRKRRAGSETGRAGSRRMADPLNMHRTVSIVVWNAFEYATEKIFVEGEEEEKTPR
jgi:hypothetical protein